MGYDKVVDSTQLDADLTTVANAIRAKSGGSDSLAFPSGFVSEIGNISGGGGVDLFSELLRVELTESAAAVKLDFDSAWESEYDVFVIAFTSTTNAREWVYYGFDTTSPSAYLSAGVVDCGFAMYQFGSWRCSKLEGNGAQLTLTSFPGYFYLKLYYETSLFLAGSTFVILGGKYADL